MLDWSKIDTWQKFQRLCNALFELEMNSTDFKPSDPNIGGDGGQDGILRHNGNYLGNKGTFLIQSKHQKEGTQPRDAFDKIKKEINEKEFDNYKKHKADCLFLCVNISLNTTTDYRLELENLAAEAYVKVVVCDKEWLEIRILKHPYLSKIWFDGVQNLSIETPAEYFLKYEKELRPADELFCESRYNDLDSKFTNFLISTDKFMGIFAPGGEGKTHYLRNIVLNHVQNLGRECYFLKDLEKKVSDIFEHELNSENQYLLVVDDLDKWLQADLRSLLKHTQHAQQIKLLFTSRIANDGMFKECLESLGITYPCLHYFPNWLETELLELLHKFTCKEKLEDEKAIVARFNKPFYLKLVADTLNNNSGITTQNIVSFIVNREKNLFRNIVSGIIKSELSYDLDLLLLELSLILPAFQAEEIQNVFIKYLKISKKDAENVIEALIKDGFLRNIGRSYRFSPDMKGDIFIANAFDVLKGDQINGAIEERFNFYPETVVKNLFYSIAYEDKSYQRIKKCLDELANRILAQFNLSNVDGLSASLHKIEYLAIIFPEKGVTLMNDALSFIESGKLQKKPWNSDKFASLLKALMRHKECDADVIKFLFKMNELQLNGYYDNQKIHSLLSYFVSPAYFKIEVVDSRLEALLKIEVFPNNVQLLKAAIQELLSGAYEHNKSLSHAFVIGAVPFNNSNKGINIRNKCVNFVIEKLLLSPEHVLISAALDIIDDLGQIRLGGAPADPERDTQVDQERKRFFDAINSEKFLLNDFHIISRIEKMLLRWWSSEPIDFKSEIEQFLISKIPTNSEFLLYKYFERGILCILKPFKEYYKECPPETTERWHWLVDNVEANRYRWKEENYLDFVRHLQNEHSTIDEKISLFDRFRNITDLSFDKIWDVWANIAEEDFYKIIQDDKKWSLLPIAVQKIVFRNLAGKAEKFPEVREKYKESFYRKLPEPDKDEMSLFLSLVKDEPVECKKLFDIFAKKSSHSLVASLLFELRRESQEIQKDFLTKYLSRITNFDDHQAEDNIAFMLRLFSENNANFINDNLRQLLVQKLLNTKIWADDVVEIFQFAKFSKEQLWELFKNRKLNDWSSEEKVPYLFISSLKKIFTPESYEFIFYKLLNLEYHIWPNSFSELVNMTDEKGALRVSGLFKDLTDRSNLLITTLRNLDFQDIAFPLWKEGASLIVERIKLGEFKIADIPEEFKPDDSSKSFKPDDVLLTLLSYKTTPSGGYSSSPGEPPPAFVSIKNLFLRLKREINEPLLNTVVDKCIRFVDENINDSINRDKLFTLER